MRGAMLLSIGEGVKPLLRASKHGRYWIFGYKGTGPIRLSFDNGEVYGVCNASE
jgi:hypothetical protein